MCTPDVDSERVIQGASRDSVIVTGLALLLRVVVSFWAWDRVGPTADGRFYHVVAQRIAAGDGYTWLWPDGVVTYAAHYPVGYPSLMAPIYWAWGPVPGLVMLMNALIGALAVWAVHGLSLELARRWVSPPWVRTSATVAALFIALCPTLLAYTPALMTESAVGAFLVLGCRLTLYRPRSWPSMLGKLGGLVLCVGLATYLRPQSVLMAPILGWLATSGGNIVAGAGAFSRVLRLRIVTAALVTIGVLGCTAPWVARNCDKMNRCLFVSANGGWNLLIGTFPEGQGAWVSLDGARVPVECREVYGEAEKDACFQAAGVRRIRASPGPWIKLIPAKLRATFDYTASGAEHLREAGSIQPPILDWLKAAEIGWQRVMFLLLALGGWRWSMRTDLAEPASGLLRSWGSHLLLGLSLIGFAGGGVWWAWLPCSALWLMNWRLLTEPAAVFAWTSIGTTAVVHAVFFGAGRYSMPILFAVGPLLSVGVGFLLNFRRMKPSSAGDGLSPQGID